MKYPCGMIRDLLPLYADGVCGEESAEIVKEHLSECKECGERLKTLSGIDGETEMNKAASFKGIKRKLIKKQIVIVLTVIALLAVGIFAAVSILKNSSGIIVYDDNISVNMTEGGLTARLSGNEAEILRVKRVESDEGSLLFFRMSANKWIDIVTSDKVFSEYLLCPVEKGAETVSAVYYYAGEIAGLESLNSEELQTVKDSSVLLWSK